MSRPELTAEQSQIISSPADQIAVLASAGAGKTRVLVDRYLQHVLTEGISPDQILTITFTRKAAAEMKERIVSGLRESEAYDQAQIAETGPIQTIHALCEQLLRENAIEAGIDARFEILSEAASARLQIEAVQEAVATADIDSPASELLISELTGRRRPYGLESPYGLLQDSVREALDKLRSAGLSYTEVQEIYSTPESFSNACKDAVLASQPPSVTSAYQQQPGEDWRAGLRAATKLALRSIPSGLRFIPPVTDDERNDLETCGLMTFALEAWALLEAKMRRSQQFDFNYLETLAVRMLDSSPLIRNRVREKFAVVMVDEAQDLNRKQHRLVQILGTSRVLTVGDGQQSIYGFRHADPDLFRESHAEGAMRLSRNFRSVAGILCFVDRIFGHAWGGDYRRMQEMPELDLDVIAQEDYSGVEFWQMGPPNVSTATYVARLIAEGEQPGEICVLTRNGATCQTIQAALATEGVPSKIYGGSEKFYTRMEVRDLANLLRSLADPYDDFALLATLRGPAVGLSLDSIIRLAVKKPVVEALRSEPLSSLDDAKLTTFFEWFEPLLACADRLSAWEVLERVLTSTSFLHELGKRPNARQQIANVRKLLVLATQDSRLGPLEFSDQIREIQELRHKEGDAEEARDQTKLVRIMTIHKAKGLEFPIVVLPETNKKLTKSPSDILYDSKLSLLVARFGRSEGFFHRYVSERLKEKDLAEELRVLYVAMTRAKNRLCVAVYPPVSGDTVSGRMRMIFGDPPPESIRLRKPIEIA